MQISAQLKEDDFISFSSPDAIYRHFNLLPFALLSLQQAVSPQTAGCLYSPHSIETWNKNPTNQHPTRKPPQSGGRMQGKASESSGQEHRCPAAWISGENLRISAPFGEKNENLEREMPPSPSEQWTEGTGPMVLCSPITPEWVPLLC